MSYKDYIIIGVLVIWLILSLIYMRKNKCSGSCGNCKNCSCPKNAGTQNKK